MCKQHYALYLFYVLIFGKLSSCITDDESEKKLYSNKWVVRVDGGIAEANRIARRHGFKNLGQVGSLEGFYHFQHDDHPVRSRRSVDERTARLSDELSVEFAEQQIIKRRVKRDFNLNDPLFPKQWFIKNTDKVFHDYDHNVLPVWQKGITGKGVVVTILDDGIEYTHKDLAANYDKLASYDYNSNDADPIPRSTWNDENRHGTRCAGEVSAVGNNSICGVGVAPGAKVGGVRMLDGDVTDAVEASSLSLQPQHIDIYSSSWGPDDDGRTVDGPAKLARKAFADGILHGRKGLGSIYVWASGNGGRQKDSCNCDGYTNSIYTLSISSSTDHGTSPWYSEYCSSTLATTYSSGSWGQKKIATTDLHGKCTESHTGTSASAPLAAGILALALEVNPQLTWRDMQHIVVRTSRTEKLTSDDFVTNAVGRKVSHKFGYGLLDAAALVDLASRWKTVPAQHICHEIPDATQRTIPATGTMKVQMSTKACEGTANFVRYIEHVEAVISLKYSRRGDLAIYLTSPKGTKSTLLAKRPSDSSSKGFTNWPFMSTHTWEEDPRGSWTLEIENKGGTRNKGSVQHWSLVFYGTSQVPFEDVKVKEAIPACNLECDGECTGPSATECKKCKHFRKETTKECVAACSSNEFAATAQKTCKLCSTACATCNGSSNSECLSCHPPLLLQLGTCVNMCSEGWYKNTVGSTAVCKKCDNNCLSCVVNAKQCTSCKPSHKLINRKCEVNCNEREFREGDFCKPCHPSCLTCNGDGESACTKCGTRMSGSDGSGSKNDSLFLHEGECKSTCPHGFYGDTAGHECKGCDKGCSTCAGPAGNQCLVCGHGLNRVGSPTGNCVDKCPQGQYADLAQSVCKPCDAKCQSCEHTDPAKCTACNDGQFLSDNKCLTASDCPGGTYPNVTLKECDKCHESCSRCSGTTQQQCSGCLDGFHLYNSQCLLKCPNGTFPSESRRCLPCHSDCLTCYGEKKTQCLSCKSPRSLFQSKCMTQCPGETFSDQELQQCVACDLTCAECSGASPEHCTKCKDSWKLTSSKCIQPCHKGGQYMSKDGCHDCHSSCVSCTGPSNRNCTSCQGVKFLDTLTHLCSYECPSAYYGEEQSGICKPCPPGCSKCRGPGYCKDCEAGLVLVEKRCQNHCPSGTYKTPTNTCEPCDSTCRECTTSPAHCIQCKDHEMLSGQNCVTICPQGTFLEPSTKKCLTCDDSCAECSGAKSSDCTRCRSTSVKVGSRCLTSCPAQYYYNEANEQCQPCDYYCHTCNGGDGRVNCTKCVEPFVLHKHYCVRVCPKEGWYHNREQQKCVSCHSSCRRCIGPTDHDCISCNDPASPLIGFTCRTNCPSEMFHNLETGLCEKCHPTCKSCTGSSKQKCKDCVKGLVFDSKSGECNSVCPSEQYSEAGKCWNCSLSCKTCNGPSEGGCLSCKESQFLYKQSCVKKCPEELYGDPLKRRCVACHPLCRTCNGTSANNCLSCRAPFYFQNTSCVLSCSPSHFLDKASRVCKPCGQNCPDAVGQPHDRSIHDTSLDNFNFFLEDPHQTGVTLFIVLSVIFAVVLFFVVFGILQINSYRKYRKYRIIANGDSNGNLRDDQKQLMSDDPEDDDFDTQI